MVNQPLISLRIFQHTPGTYPSPESPVYVLKFFSFQGLGMPGVSTWMSQEDSKWLVNGL